MKGETPMSKNEILKDLAEALSELDLDRTLRAVNKAVKNRIPFQEIMAKGLSKGMGRVGELFESNQYFLADLLASAEIMKRAMDVLLPQMDVENTATKGKIVIGTVLGDFHDIGKNTVVAVARGAGFEVIDLGIDVPTEKFVEAAKKHKPDILGLSALLSSTIPQIKNTIEALEKAGVRKSVYIAAGGRPLTMELAKKLGADGYAEDAFKAVKLFQEVTGKAT